MKNSYILRTLTKFIILIIAVIGITLGIKAGQTITIKGSDTMILLGQRWSEAYMSKNPQVAIQVTGGGSGAGLASLINGTTEICESSRPIKPGEIEKLKERFNTPGVEIPVARDGLSIYVHESNAIQELTMKQIMQIYTSEITNWKDLGGPDAKIILYGRENNSGTYSFFKEHVLQNEDFSPFVQGLPGTASVVNAVSKDVHGVGYGGAAYAKGIKLLSVRKNEKSEAFAPTLENVKSGAYPLSRNLFWYLRNKPTGEIKKLVEFVLSPEGQAVVTQVGYFPVN